MTVVTKRVRSDVREQINSMREGQDSWKLTDVSLRAHKHSH